MLVRIYPMQAATLLTKRNASLAALDVSRGEERRGAVAPASHGDRRSLTRFGRGGRPMASRPILRQPFRGAAVNGVWRPTPPANLDGARDRTSPR